MNRLIPSMISETEFINGLSALIEYYEKFGSLKNIRPDETYKYEGKLIYIGAFVKMLKMEHKKGLLDKTIAEPLHNMGIEWEYDRFAPLRAYYKEFGTIANIKQSDTYNYQGEGFKIGLLISRLRAEYNKGKLAKEEIIELEQMGMAWNYDRIAILRAYYNEFGTIANIKKSTIYNYQGEGFKIGVLISSLRTEYNKGKLAEEEVTELEKMGMIWNANKVYDRLSILRAYYDEFGTISNVKSKDIFKYQGKDVKIGALIWSLRGEYKKAKLTKEEINELESMGMVWKVFEFNDRIAPLIAYYNEFGTISNIRISDVYKYQGQDIKIGSLINHLRNEYNDGELTDEEIDKLESMGMIWSRAYDRLVALRAYYKEFGAITNIKISDVYRYKGKDVKIGRLINHLRTKYKKGELAEGKIELLNSMGMVWDATSRKSSKNRCEENIQEFK